MKTYDASFLTPSPVIQADIDLVREMNMAQRSLVGPFEAWPQWAHRDVQLAANHRCRFAAPSPVPVQAPLGVLSGELEELPTLDLPNSLIALEPRLTGVACAELSSQPPAVSGEDSRR